jgi:hypothetical protein
MGAAFVEYFKAEEPSLENQSKKKRVIAQISIVIHFRQVMIHAVEVPANPDSARWVGTVDELTWEALMNPKSSWWNPKKRKGKDAAKILEHEQGHCDIAELEARHENERKTETAQRVSATARTQEEVIAKVEERLHIESTRVYDNMMAWSSKYELETKNGTDKNRQKEWQQRIQEWLAGSPSGETP